jgi:hypothetical protein
LSGARVGTPRLLLALVALGTALRALQYFRQPSLWLDEVALARGILGWQPLASWATPLPYDQIAPRGFVLAEWLVVAALGSGDLALRLLPFVSSLLALWLFARVAPRLLDGAGPGVALLLFAAAPALIAYAAMVKQYASDACVSVLLLALALELHTQPLTRARLAFAAAAGALAVWLSLSGVLVLAGLGAALLWLCLASPQRAARCRALLPVWLCWGVAAAGAVVVSLAGFTEHARIHQQRFWDAGYPPVPFDGPRDFFWPLGRVTSLYGGSHLASLAYWRPEIYVALTFIGLIALWRRRRAAALLCLGPPAVALLAASLRRYPFSERLLLYLLPFFLLAVGAGVEALRARAARIRPAFGAAVVALLLVPALAPALRSPPPYYREDIEPVIAHVAARRQPDDRIYVFFAAAPAFEWYAERYGLPRASYAIGGCHRDSQGQPYLQELDAFRGRSRLWFVFTHASRDYERRDLLGYLGAIGTLRERFVARSRAAGRRPQNAEALLYDLSDAERLSSVRADQFPTRGPSPTDARVPCDEGPLQMIRGDFS